MVIIKFKKKKLNIISINKARVKIVPLVNLENIIIEQRINSSSIRHILLIYFDEEKVKYSFLELSLLIHHYQEIPILL